jgi:glutamate---cysteine ligase / carboxylate-amine ligase
MTANAFGHDFTLGIEEELLLVDADTGQLSPQAAAVLHRADSSREAADHELYAAQLELRSGRCRRVSEAISALGSARAAVRQAGGTLMGSGLHPAAPFGTADLVADDRYQRVKAMFRGLVGRTPEAALHIHVGMPDERTAVQVFNGLREYLPLLAALAANSPWWFGTDSGLASSRAALVRAYPTRGIPPAMQSYDTYTVAVAEIVRAAGMPDYTFIYWDMRLHPRLGTVEIREMDAQSGLDDVAPIAALAQSLAAAIAHGAVPAVQKPSEPDALSWSSFLAARDGVSAKIWHGGRHCQVREASSELVRALRPVASSLGCADELAAIGRILHDGEAAYRQRAVAQASGLDGLLRYLITATS